jgi:hypothetical protein
MGDSHTGQNITGSEWVANLELTRQALRKNGVASREDGEFVSLLEHYRNDIVEAEKASRWTIKRLKALPVLAPGTTCRCSCDLEAHWPGNRQL